MEKYTLKRDLSHQFAFANYYCSKIGCFAQTPKCFFWVLSANNSIFLYHKWLINSNIGVCSFSIHRICLFLGI